LASLKLICPFPGAASSKTPRESASSRLGIGVPSERNTPPGLAVY